MVSFPFSCQKHKGLFLQHLLGKPGWAPEGKSQKFLNPPQWVVLVKFLTLRVVYTELTAVHQLRFKFSYLTLVPSAVSAHESLFWWAVTSCIFLSVSPVWGAILCPVSFSLLRIQEMLIQSVQFLLVVKMEWWLPSLLHVEPYGFPFDPCSKRPKGLGGIDLVPLGILLQCW